VRKRNFGKKSNSDQHDGLRETKQKEPAGGLGTKQSRDSRLGGGGILPVGKERLPADRGKRIHVIPRRGRTCMSAITARDSEGEFVFAVLRVQVNQRRRAKCVKEKKGPTRDRFDRRGKGGGEGKTMFLCCLKKDGLKTQIDDEKFITNLLSGKKRVGMVWWGC